jgi:hypothetical protein
MAHSESASTPDTSADARWTAWLALSAERERETARRFRIVLPIIGVFAVAGLYLLAR